MEIINANKFYSKKKNTHKTYLNSIHLVLL
jgi:hypothetical protein